MSETPEKVEKPPRRMPAYYAWIYWWLVPVARDHGYALALHGSLERDLDVIAIPWAEQAASPEELANAFASFVPGWSRTESVPKPHGRTAYTIILGGGAAVDLSIMPRLDYYGGGQS